MIIKSKIYSIIIGFILIFLYTSAVPEESTNGGYITIPCPTYNVGSYRIYTSTSGNNLSIFKDYVVSNENGIIEILKKFYQQGKDQDQPSSINTEILSEKDGSITALKHISKTATNNAITTSFLRPFAICGLIPKEWKSITVTEMKLVNSENKMDTTVTIMSNKLIGEEIVKVKAGTFKATVIEVKSKLPNANVTNVNYYVQSIGLVKSITIIKTIYPEYKVYNSHPELTATDLMKGLKLLEEGKEVFHFLDSLEESVSKQEFESLPEKKIEYSTFQTIITLELVDYKIQ